MTTKNDKMGFPPGVAAKILMSMYKKYDDMARQDDKEREKILNAPEISDTNLPAVVRTEEVRTESCFSKEPFSDSSSVSSPPSSHVHSRKEKDTVPATNTTQSDSNNKEESHDGKEPISDDNDAESVRQRHFQENPASYNGAVRDSYSWSQSITDVDIQVKIPKNIMKGKEVKVVIGKKNLQVCHRGTQGEWIDLINDSLTWEVQKEESMWSLVPGEHIHVNLEKKDERWWEALLVGEEKINVRKIDASRPMTDLDDEAQAKIEEMMFNERQKRMGLPTSEEKKVQDMLKNAWDAEGSPFKGQPFDPSKLNVNSSGVVTINPEQSS